MLKTYEKTLIPDQESASTSKECVRRWDTGCLLLYINEGKPTMSIRHVDFHRIVKTSDTKYLLVRLLRSRNLVWNSKRASSGGRTTQKNGKITPPPEKSRRVGQGRRRRYHRSRVPSASKPLLHIYYTTTHSKWWFCFLHLYSEMI